MLVRGKVVLLVKIFIVLFFISILITWFVLPNHVKKYIEANDKEWINRDITINEISINLLAFKINASDVIIKEPNSNDNFVVFDNLSINFDLWEMLQSNINIEEIILTNLVGKVKQNGTQFNFSDLLSQKTAPEDSEPIDYNIKNIKVLNSSVYYIDEHLGSEIVLDSISIKASGFSSKEQFLDAKVNIHQQVGGWLNGNVFYNFMNGDYGLDSQFNGFELAPFKKYITSFIRLSKFEGQLDADIQFSGNVSNEVIKSKGRITVSDFKIIDPENKPLASVGRFYIDVEGIDSGNNVYDFNEILLEDSKVVFEYLTNGDNFTKLLVGVDSVTQKKSTSDHYVSPFEMLSVYLYDMTKEYIFKSYTAKKIQLTNFNLKFYDYTLEDPFYMDLENLEIKAGEIKPENEFAKFIVNGKLNSTAAINGNVLVSRQGVENMTIDMNVNGLILDRFSPYSRTYTAHRFMEGVASFNNKSVIKESYLTSTNTFHIDGVKVSEKDKTRNGSSLPMRLAVAIMKDAKGNIDLDIPIEGPINDPEYKFGKVIWQVVKNLFTKVVTSPVKSLANMLKIDEKDLKNIYFDNGQVGLSSLQKKPLNNISNVLNKKPELTINLNHLYNEEYELDAIALKNVKLTYLKQSDIQLDQNIPIGKHAFDLSSADPGFLTYIEKMVENYDKTISVSENARRFIGASVLKDKLNEIIIKQKELIKNYLIIEKQISENRFTIKDASQAKEAISQSRPKFEVSFGSDE